MDSGTTRYEVADRTATITFDRHDQLDAVTPLTVRELRTVHGAAAADEAVRILIVTGSGQAFYAVEPGDDAGPMTTAEPVDHLAGRLGPDEIPADLRIVDTRPRTASARVDPAAVLPALLDVVDVGDVR